jgi:hypothetical protein
MLTLSAKMPQLLTMVYALKVSTDDFICQKNIEHFKQVSAELVQFLLVLLLLFKAQDFAMASSCSFAEESLFTWPQNLESKFLVCSFATLSPESSIPLYTFHEVVPKHHQQ